MQLLVSETTHLIAEASLSDDAGVIM